MKFLGNKLVFFVALLALNSCGVKGKPQPPLESPILGRGEMVPSKKQKKEELKKKSFKSSDPDWDEKDDFIEEPQ